MDASEGFRVRRSEEDSAKFPKAEGGVAMRHGSVCKQMSAGGLITAAITNRRAFHRDLSGSAHRAATFVVPSDDDQADGNAHVLDVPSSPPTLPDRTREPVQRLPHQHLRAVAGD